MKFFSAFRFVLISTLLFSGLCSNAQAVAGDSIATKYHLIEDSAKAQQTLFHSLSMRAKLTWADEKTEQDFTGSIRIQSDSLIWVSLSGPMGIEGFRVLISPDTFKIINRLGNEYAIREFNYLEHWLLFPLSYKMLEQLLAGQLIDIPQLAVAVGREDSAVILYRENNKLLEKIWLNPQNYTVGKILLKDKMLQQDMTITFEAYNLLNGKPFSYRRAVDVHQGSMGFHLQMEISRITINDSLSFPFEINERYKKVE